MAKVKETLACPRCGTKLLEVKGHCSGVIIMCWGCNSSIMVDMDENGKMRLNLEPKQERGTGN